MMKKVFQINILILGSMIAACSNSEPKLNTQEQQAVEAQVQKDQAAMDSLDKAIQAQINEVDSTTK